MHAQLAGDGADLPMLSVKVAADLRVRLRINHANGSPSSGEWVETDRLSAPHGHTPATQPHTGNTATHSVDFLARAETPPLRLASEHPSRPLPQLHSPSGRRTCADSLRLPRQEQHDPVPVRFT